MKEIYTQEIRESDFQKLIIKNKGLALFEIVSPSSGWCLIMLTQLQKFIKTLEYPINHYRINIENSPKLVKEYHVKTIPKYLLYKNQKLICTFEGLKSLNELQDLIKYNNN